MRHRPTTWLSFLCGAALLLLGAAAARAEDDPQALMRSAMEAQLDVDPAPPELPTQANFPRKHGQERAAEVRARAAARWAARHDRDEDPEGAPARAKAARAADKAAAESVSPATKRRAYGKGGRL